MRRLFIAAPIGLLALLASPGALPQDEAESALAASPVAAEQPGIVETEVTAEGPEDAKGDPATAPGAVTSEADTLKTAEESYELKIRGIEVQVNDLKEKIFRSKARLLALQEAVIGGVSTGARAVIFHRNEMGATFRLREMHYFIDGAPLRQEVDESGDSLSAKEEIELFQGNIVPGNHQITVNLVYQGHGYGVFSYLNGYTFRIKSSYTFRAEEGKEIVIKVVAHEQGGVTTELKDRPAVRYDVNVKKYKPKKQSSDAEGAPAAP